jgi:hypothetical protein
MFHLTGIARQFLFAVPIANNGLRRSVRRVYSLYCNLHHGTVEILMHDEVMPMADGGVSFEELLRELRQEVRALSGLPAALSVVQKQVEHIAATQAARETYIERRLEQHDVGIEKRLDALRDEWAQERDALTDATRALARTDGRSDGRSDLWTRLAMWAIPALVTAIVGALAAGVVYVATRPDLSTIERALRYQPPRLP